jgi:hypothetical protein
VQIPVAVAARRPGRAAIVRWYGVARHHCSPVHLAETWQVDRKG